MFKKTTAGTVLVGAMFAATLGVSNVAEAAFESCTGTDPSYDISNKVSPNSGCTILSPLDGAVNDSVAGGNVNFANFTVNVEEFFGYSDWLFDGKHLETNGPNLVNFTSVGSGVQSGSWSITSANQALYDFMFVFKDGGDTNLVGYLITATSGSYASPFVEPPFAFTGTGPRAISHISVYYREGGNVIIEVPEPATLALLGVGLLGLAAARRRKVH